MIEGKIGATVPFTTYEAEDAKREQGACPGEDFYIREASSGKRYVSLPVPGSCVVFTAKENANRITLRYSAPFRSQAVLAVKVAGKTAATLTLNTVQCHGIKDDGRLDDGVRKFFEEAIVADVSAGEEIRVENVKGDIALDLIDLETAPAPLPRPENALSVTDFGATGEGDDSDAIEACIKAAAARGKDVFIPAGTFLQSRRIPIPAGVNFTGAGMWYSNIEFITPGHTFTDTCGYALERGNRIADIRFHDRVSHSRGDATIMLHPFGSDQLLENCWFANVGCVFGWDQECCHTVFRNSRVIGTYFDGTHWGDGRYFKNEMYDVFFRGVGDDAIAQVNRADMGLCEGNYAHHNTVIASYWGRGISNVGGDDMTLRYNRVDSCYLAGLIITTEPLGPSYSRPIRGILAEYNVFNLNGHKGFDAVSIKASNLATVHFCLKTNYMERVVLRHNVFSNGETHPVWFDETEFDNSAATLEDNEIVGF